MTNVDIVEQNASFVDKKTNIGYLTAVFPLRYGFAKRLAERLNSKGKTSITDKPYNANIISQIIQKEYDDLNIEPELVKLVEDYTGLPVSEAAPKYVR